MNIKLSDCCPANDMFESNAYILTAAENEDPMVKQELIETKQFDYSMKSLKHIDAYLNKVRLLALNKEQYLKIVIRTGSYAGEVIRRNSEIKLDWVYHEDAVSRGQLLSDEVLTLGNMAILSADTGFSCKPIGKVIKYIQNGHEDSLYAFGLMVCSTEILESLNDIGTSTKDSPQEPIRVDMTILEQ